MDLITTEELRKKEIINLCDGERLGYSSDFQFDKCTAQITALIVENGGGFLGLGCGSTYFIPWCKIECIGTDTILVNLSKADLSVHNDPKRRKKRWSWD